MENLGDIRRPWKIETKMSKVTNATREMMEVTYDKTKTLFVSSVERRDMTSTCVLMRQNVYL